MGVLIKILRTLVPLLIDPLGGRGKEKKRKNRRREEKDYEITTTITGDQTHSELKNSTNLNVALLPQIRQNGVENQ